MMKTPLIETKTPFDGWTRSRQCFGKLYDPLYATDDGGGDPPEGYKYCAWGWLVIAQPYPVDPETVIAFAAEIAQTTAMLSGPPTGDHFERWGRAREIVTYANDTLRWFPDQFRAAWRTTAEAKAEAEAATARATAEAKAADAAADTTARAEATAEAATARADAMAKAAKAAKAEAYDTAARAEAMAKAATARADAAEAAAKAAKAEAYAARVDAGCLKKASAKPE